MDRYSFLNQLSLLLLDMPKEERQDALNYYDDYFRDASDRTDEDIIRELGSPEEVAEKIKEDFVANGGGNKGKEKNPGQEPDDGQEWDREYTEEQAWKAESQWESKEESYKEQETGTSKRNGCLWAILLIVTSPIWFSIGVSIFGLLFGLALGIVGICLGLGVLAAVLFVGGAAIVIAGIIKSFAILPVGLAVTGVGLLMLAAALLLINLCILVFGKVIPAAIHGISSLFRKLFGRKRGRE